MNLLNKPNTLNADNFCLLRVKGRDARHFMNNQLTVDVPDIDGEWGSAAWCNAKGRVIAVLEIMRKDEAYYLLIYKDLADIFKEKISHFILRSKVRIDHLNESFYLKWEPVKALGHWKLGSLAGYGLVVGTNDEVNTTDADDYLIAEGYPLINQQASEEWIAQQLNLDRLNMVDFKKGCYPGQEVIARIYYKGAVKKRMQLIESNKPILANNLDDKQVLIAASSKSVGRRYFAIIMATVTAN